MHKHYKIIILIFVIMCFLIFNLANSISQADSFINKKTIIIGGDNYFPPYEYLDKNGVYKGFNVDIMRAIAIETGLDIEIRPMPWFEAVLALNEGQIDAIQGMKYSSYREDSYDFSDEYLTSSQSIFVQSDNSFIINLEDLDGKKIAIQKNDIAIDTLKNLPNIDLIETENQEIALNKLMIGEVTAFVGNRQTGLYIIQKNGYRNAIKIVGDELLAREYGIAVKEGNVELLEIFNDGLKKIKKNGTYDKIYKKWFGEYFHTPSIFTKKILYFSISGLLLSLLITLIFYRLNNILKKEVDKRTQDLIRESTFKEQTLNSIFSALITLDNKGYILSANEKVLSFTNCHRENLIGEYFKNTIIKDYFNEEDFYEVLKSRKEKMSIEKNLYLNKQKRVFEYNIYPLLLSNDEVYGATLTFKDVTQEKLMREKLIMQDKMESLGRLVAGIAHEIRNPLTAIKTYIELIPFKYNKEEFRRKIAEDVPDEIDRLNTIIISLLEYSKPREPKKEYLNVYETIQDIIRFFSNQVQNKGIHLSTCIDKDMYINVDKQQFKQIIINLLLNSIQAVEDTIDPQITIYTEDKHSSANISIKDNGCGIASENIGRIFDPFFTTKDSGTGLGLSISYQFIKENNGDVYVESNTNMGTAIHMKFPSLMKDWSEVHV